MTRSTRDYLGAVPPAAVADERVRIMIQLIEHSGYSKAEIQKAAGSVYLSVSRLSHLFKQEVGISPLEYAKTLKLERAKRLIEETQARIKEIAALVGYKDSKSLIRDFKAVYGLTPRNYRSRHQAARAGSAVE